MRIIPKLGITFTSLIIIGGILCLFEGDTAVGIIGIIYGAIKLPIWIYRLKTYDT